MANPGYGKRNAPGQSPRTRRDFEHLPAREAALAALIDRLPEGAAMDAKTLAALSPEYGQAACRSALKRLSEAGHVRRITEHLAVEGGRRWVTRTYFSRSARSDAWWQRFLDGDLDAEAEEERPAAPPRAPAGRPARSRAYAALAALGCADSRLSLSAAECAALEPLAAEWLARGADEGQLTTALTAGLPVPVHCAGALVRRRLTDKMPPELPAPELSAARQPLRIMECALCAVPGRPEALPGGLCRDCRGEAPRPQRPDALAEEHVRQRIALLRAGVRDGASRQRHGELRDRPQTARV
nr:hypothetical protein [Streptomyces orinoci]